MWVVFIPELKKRKGVKWIFFHCHICLRKGKVDRREKGRGRKVAIQEGKWVNRRRRETKM